MKKAKLIAVVALCALSIVACKKTGLTTNSSQEQVSSQNAVLDESKLTPIQQKHYPVSEEQAKSIVKRFKHIDDNPETRLLGKLIESDSVSIDSAIFVVEAALNYDFDYNNPNPANFDQEDFEPYDTQFTIPKSRVEMKISSDDLEDVYEELTGYINDSINDTVKVKIIDITAYTIGSSQVTFQAKIRRVRDITRQEYYCGTNTNGGLANQPLVANPSPALVIVLYYLRNCDFPLTNCQGSFYINVQTVGHIGSTTNSSALYYNSFPPNLYTVDPTYLPAAAINSLRNGAVSLIQSYYTTPISPVTINHKAVGLSMSGGTTGHPFAGGSIATSFWMLQVTYGVVVSPC